MQEDTSILKKKHQVKKVILTGSYPKHNGSSGFGVERTDLGFPGSTNFYKKGTWKDIFINHQDGNVSRNVEYLPGAEEILVEKVPIERELPFGLKPLKFGEVLNAHTILATELPPTAIVPTQIELDEIFGYKVVQPFVFGRELQLADILTDEGDLFQQFFFIFEATQQIKEKHNMFFDMLGSKTALKLATNSLLINPLPIFNFIYSLDSRPTAVMPSAAFIYQYLANELNMKLPGFSAEFSNLRIVTGTELYRMGNQFALEQGIERIKDSQFIVVVDYDLYNCRERNGRRAGVFEMASRLQDTILKKNIEFVLREVEKRNN